MSRRLRILLLTVGMIVQLIFWMIGTIVFSSFWFDERFTFDSRAHMIYWWHWGNFYLHLRFEIWIMLILFGKYQDKDGYLDPYIRRIHRRLNHEPFFK